jgi:hypothetical protein
MHFNAVFNKALLIERLHRLPGTSKKKMSPFIFKNILR